MSSVNYNILIVGEYSNNPYWLGDKVVVGEQCEQVEGGCG